VAEQAAPLQLVTAGNGSSGLSTPVLGGQVAEAAADLAEEIESLYVYGDYAGTFNVPTNLDLRLKERIVLFDFSQVPER
ncbi:MAG: hypothetical protein KDE29_23950, partial [Anaerolineales bacterium]|nr:hypothetical protein [Anaerolineales bacterium]